MWSIDSYSPELLQSSNKLSLKDMIKIRNNGNGYVNYSNNDNGNNNNNNDNNDNNILVS